MTIPNCSCGGKLSDKKGITQNDLIIYREFRCESCNKIGYSMYDRIGRDVKERMDIYNPIA